MSNPDIAPEGAEGAAPLRSELAFSLLLFAVACVFFFTAREIDSDAEIWPKTLAFVMMVLTLLQCGRACFRLMRDGAGPMFPDPVALIRRVFAAGWIVGYCLVAPWTGFGPAMLVMMPVYMWVAGERRVWMIVLATGSALAIVSFLFGYVAGVPVWEADL